MSSIYALACISGSTSQLYLKLSSENLEASSQSILPIRNTSKASLETPRPFQAWCHSVILGATHLSAPHNTHYTFYNLPRPPLAHYHAYNNPQQLIVLTKHKHYNCTT